METADLLRRIGMTEGEIKVYLAMMKTGESTISPICRESKVSKSKIYDILDRLIAKGFAAYFVKNGTRHFLVSDPEMILEYLRKEEKKIEDQRREAERILPRLKMQRIFSEKKAIAEIYEGFRGLRTIREELIAKMKKDDEFLVLGAPKIANEKWEGWFINFHKRRESHGISMRIIYNSNAREFGARRKRFRLTKVRYLPSDLVSPNWIDIFNESVLFVMVIKEPITFVVHDMQLAQSFRSYFNIMWNVSKK